MNVMLACEMGWDKLLVLVSPQLKGLLKGPLVRYQNAQISNNAMQSTADPKICLQTDQLCSDWMNIEQLHL